MDQHFWCDVIFKLLSERDFLFKEEFNSNLPNSIRAEISFFSICLHMFFMLVFTNNNKRVWRHANKILSASTWILTALTIKKHKERPFHANSKKILTYTFYSMCDKILYIFLTMMDLCDSVILDILQGFSPVALCETK